MRTKQDVIQYIENNREEYIETALHIWDNPELCFKEYESSGTLKKLLKKHGFTIEDNVAGLETAFIASYGSGEPVIGYMGEYDALPELSQKADITTREEIVRGGAGHGCGHHVLGTAAAAAAIAHAMQLESTGNKGTVRFYGCPAEEGGGGKVLMADAGLFDDCAAAISWHATDDNGIWSINFYASQKMEITFIGADDNGLAKRHTGKGKDVGGNGREAWELFNMGIHILRQHLPKGISIQTRTINLDDADIYKTPSDVRIWCRVKGFSQKDVKRIVDRVVEIARGAAKMTECHFKAHLSVGYSEMLPNRALERIMYDQYETVGTVHMTSEEWEYADRMHTAIEGDCEMPTFNLMRLLYEEQAEPIIEKVRGKSYNDILYPFREININKPGGTDICDVSWYTPTTQCVAACYIKDTLGHSWQEVSQGRSSICMKGMLVAAKVMALTGIELTDNPSALKAVRNEFETKRRGKEYEPMLPELREG